MSPKIPNRQKEAMKTIVATLKKNPSVKTFSGSLKKAYQAVKAGRPNKKPIPKPKASIIDNMNTRKRRLEEAMNL